MNNDPIRGVCDPRFAPVRDAFAENFRSEDEVGATVAVTHRGESVVDLWGGYADAGRTRPWERDTLVCMMSVAKGVIALCAHLLVDRGVADLDAPVARYWPEFAQNGKEGVLLRHLLDHRSGLPAIDRPMPPGAIYDWHAMCQALEEQAPLFPPGTDRADQSVTMGFLIGEVVRRATGRSIGAFLREEICRPFGLDYHIGLAPEHHARCAEFFGTEGSFFDVKDPGSLLHRALAQLPVNDFNAPAFLSAEIPSINGIGTARSIARLFGVLACGGTQAGVRLVGRDTLARAIEEQWSGTERVVGNERRVALGFLLNTPSFTAMGPNPSAFGHSGAGGSIGFADPESEIGFSYAMNRMHGGIYLSPRLTRLVDAVFTSL